MTKERPILFNAEMVRAILEGRKTQTRRIVKPQPPNWASYAADHMDGWFFHDSDQDTDSLAFYPEYESKGLSCPFGKVGDRLWVRETWAKITHVDTFNFDRPHKIAKDDWMGPKEFFDSVIWRADGEVEWEDEDGGFSEKSHWKPSIHMPRWASRITLEITGIRVERVQDISDDDAYLEGVEPVEYTENYGGDTNDVSDYRQGFWDAWDSIYSNWNDNPWVWVIEFKRIEEKQNDTTKNKEC